MSTAMLPKRRMPVESTLSERFFRSSPERADPDFLLTDRVPAAPQDSIAVRFGKGFLLFDQRPDEWIIPILKEISALGDLAANWNSYGGQPIRPEAAEAALDVLLSLLLPTDSLPAIVPTGGGGIMLEWHEKGIDLEIEIRSLFEIHLTIESEAREEEIPKATRATIEEALNKLRAESYSPNA